MTKNCSSTTDSVHLARSPAIIHPGSESDHSPPTSADLTNAWICTSASHTSS